MSGDWYGVVHYGAAFPSVALYMVQSEPATPEEPVVTTHNWQRVNTEADIVAEVCRRALAGELSERARLLLLESLRRAEAET